MLFLGFLFYLGLFFIVDRYGFGELSDEVDFYFVDWGIFECWFLLISFIVGM